MVVLFPGPKPVPPSDLIRGPVRGRVADRHDPRPGSPPPFPPRHIDLNRRGSKTPPRREQEHDRSVRALSRLLVRRLKAPPIQMAISGHSKASGATSASGLDRHRPPQACKPTGSTAPAAAERPSKKKTCLRSVASGGVPTVRMGTPSRTTERARREPRLRDVCSGMRLEVRYVTVVALVSCLWLRHEAWKAGPFGEMRGRRRRNGGPGLLS